MAGTPTHEDESFEIVYPEEIIEDDTSAPEQPRVVVANGVEDIHKSSIVYINDEDEDLPPSLPSHKAGSSRNMVLYAFLTAMFLFLIWGLTQGWSHKQLTPEEQADAVQKCTQWGGSVVYDDQGAYKDCATPYPNQ